jgi:hypothetical protein
MNFQVKRTKSDLSVLNKNKPIHTPFYSECSKLIFLQAVLLFLTEACEHFSPIL